MEMGGPSAARPMADNTDPRAVRTRARLVDAFHEAVRDQDPSEMSVSALARAAGINRTSFYTHFASPEDLAIHALAELFDVVSDADLVMRRDGTASPADASRRTIGGIVDFVAARRETYARLLGPGAAPRLQHAVTATFVEHSVETLEGMPGRPPGADPLVTARFLAGGVLGVVGQWLGDEGADEWPPARLVEALVLCLPAWLTDPST